MHLYAPKIQKQTTGLPINNDCQSLHEESDLDMVQRCLNGDEVGMRGLVERYQSIVFGLCYRMLGHREDAEDIVQDVFLRMFRSLRNWDQSRPLKPWLLTIAANRCRTALTQLSRRPTVKDFAFETIADTQPITSEGVGEEIQLALEKARPEYRLCFILFYQQELNCSEIATIMDCPEGTIKTWLHRVRRELADHLQRRGIRPNVCPELR